MFTLYPKRDRVNIRSKQPKRTPFWYWKMSTACLALMPARLGSFMSSRPKGKGVSMEYSRRGKGNMNNIMIMDDHARIIHMIIHHTCISHDHTCNHTCTMYHVPCIMYHVSCTMYHVLIHTHTHTHTHTYTHSYTCTHTHTYPLIHHTCTHTYTYMYSYMYPYTYIHIHIHTHTYIPFLPPFTLVLSTCAVSIFKISNPNLVPIHIANGKNFTHTSSLPIMYFLAETSRSFFFDDVADVGWVGSYSLRLVRLWSALTLARAT